MFKFIYYELLMCVSARPVTVKKDALARCDTKIRIFIHLGCSVLSRQKNKIMKLKLEIK
jgi:hypothetical protein